MSAIETFWFGDDYKKIELKKPIFIVGLPRSGTTLLYNLISAHENVGYVTNSINVYPNSPRAIEWLRKKLNLNIRGERFFRDSILTDFSSPSEPIMFWGKWFNRDVETLFWESKRIGDFTKKEISTVYDDIRKTMFTFGNNCSRFVCKYPVIQTELLLLQDIFPDAKFIHILRDGRSTANSLRKLYNISNDQLKKINHPKVKHVIPYPRVRNLKQYVDQYGPGSLETTARVWADAIEMVHQVSDKLNHYYEFRYEDLLKNPLSEMQKIFDFCELNWPQHEKFSHLFREVGRTHHINEYFDFDRITEIVKPTLKKLGYI